jgi:hypothetical protein
MIFQEVHVALTVLSIACLIYHRNHNKKKAQSLLNFYIYSKVPIIPHSNVKVVSDPMASCDLRGHRSKFKGSSVSKPATL